MAAPDLPCPDVPLLGATCDAVNDGLDSVPSLPTPQGVAGDVATAVGGGILREIANGFFEAFVKMMTWLTTWWVDIDTTRITADGGSYEPTGVFKNIQNDLHYYVVIAAIIGLLLSALRLATARNGQAAEEGARALVRVLITSAAVPAMVTVASVSGDEFSSWIIKKSAGGSNQDVEAKLLGLSAAQTLAPGLLLIFAILGLIASVIQAFLMVLRGAVMIVLAAFLPFAAATSATQTGKASYDRAIAWLIAFVLYKPVAAVIYAATLYSIKKGDAPDPANPTDTDAIRDVTTAAGLAVIAVLALPALVKLVAPVVSQVGGGGGGGTAAIGAVATGAIPMAHAMSAGGGGGRSGPGATGAAPTPSSGTQGTPGTRGGRGPGGPPGGGGPSGGPSGGGGGGGAAAGRSAAGAGAAAGGGAAAAGAGPAGAAAAAGVEAVSRGADATRRAVRDVTNG